MNKFLGLLLTGWAVIFLIACDDITSPPSDPSAQAEKLQKELKKTPLEPKPAEITRENLIETYNLIVEIRNGLKDWERKLDELIRTKSLYYAAERGDFRGWVESKGKMLSIREERISPFKQKYPQDHPAIPLYLAILKTKEMLENYIYHYHTNDPFKPELEKELKKHMEDFQARMKTFVFPEYQPGPAPVIK